MTYTIKLYERHRVREQRTSNERLSTIQESARQHVETGIGDRVEVYDDAGSLVFHYPRVTQRA